MLQEAGADVDPLEDIGTETERLLGKLVKEKYDTDFYMLTRYPLNARPFYTMPAADDPNYTNSFDIFIEGKKSSPARNVFTIPSFSPSAPRRVESRSRRFNRTLTLSSTVPCRTAVAASVSSASPCCSST